MRRWLQADGDLGARVPMWCMNVDVPETLLGEIDQLVASGAFQTRDAAVQELLRLGLEAWRQRTPGGPRPLPGRPPIPPGRRDPGDDTPISVNPEDVNWME